MATYSPLLETPGTIIGGLLRDSNITFPHGKYVVGTDLATQLLDNGVKSSWPIIHREILLSPSYGESDNIWTRVQTLSYYDQESRNGHNVIKYSFNLWKELMGGLPLDQLSNPWIVKNSGMGYGPLEITVENPRKGAERLKALYKLFADLNQSYQDDFLGELDTHPCTLYVEMNVQGKFKRWVDHPKRSILTRNMLKGLSSKDRRNLQYTLDLMAIHDLCFSKGPIVRSEIEDLMGYDTSKIPTEWMEGTLDDDVIQERVAELNEMLEEKALR